VIVMATPATTLTRCECSPRRRTVKQNAFTLIELLVVVVILSVLASLSLAGLAAARQRSKADKTRSTIRKIDAVIRPMYDSYRTRRVVASAGATSRATAQNVLLAKRDLILREMPDSAADVTTVAGFSSLPNYISFRVGKSAVNGSAECLYMILARSGFDPEALESFRSDEVGDTDTDIAPEFLDGWGKPIIFLRWAPGWLPPASTVVQFSDPVNAHDPLDPFRVDSPDYDGTLPSSTGYALIPLIASGGPDELPGITETPSGWVGSYRPLKTLIVADGSSPPVLIGSPSMGDPTAYRDNITNHDLSRK
jgi:prepilin-type N-terminal cleavage/methylation domain-containing protein